MFGLSEFLVLFLIAFLVLGPEEFPKSFRKILRLINSFKHALSRLKTEIHDVKKGAEDMFLEEEKKFYNSIQNEKRDSKKDKNES